MAVVAALQMSCRHCAAHPCAGNGCVLPRSAALAALFAVLIVRRVRISLPSRPPPRKASPTIRSRPRPHPRASPIRRPDARAGGRGRLRLQQQSRLRGRQCPAVLQRHQRRSRQGDLRPEDQAAARRRQHPHDGCRRQDHLCQRHGSERRLPRRLRRFAAGRHRRCHAHGRDAVRPLQRQLHGVRERRLHGLRPLQGRSEEAAAVAGQGRAHHSRPEREDAVFRDRAARILRRADRLHAVFLDARSDREAQERLPDAGLHREHDLRLRRGYPVLLGDRTRHGCDLHAANHHPPGRADARPNSASA